MKFFTLFLYACALFFAAAPVPSIAATEASPPAASPAPAKKASGEIWSERCNAKEKADGPKRGRCEVFQRLIVKDTGQRLVEVAVGFPREKKTARGIVIVPLGILLQSGVQLKIDDGEPFKFQIRYCDNAGCFGYVDLNDGILNTMRSGKKIVLTFQAAKGKTVNVELSLKDFSKALDQVD